jgi:hypothetical protein
VGEWNFLQNCDVFDFGMNILPYHFHPGPGLDAFLQYPALSADPFNSFSASPSIAWLANGVQHTTNDNPNANLFGDLTGALGKFETYVMFRPPGTGSQWVPLRRLVWAFAAMAEKSWGTWTVKKAFQGTVPANGVFPRETSEPLWSQVIPSPSTLTLGWG